MDLHSATQLSLVFLKGGNKAGGTKVDAWHSELIQPSRQFLWTNPGRPNQLKRTRRSPPFRNICPLQQTCSGINNGGIQSGNVGRREHPRQAGFVEPHFSFPAL